MNIIAWFLCLAIICTILVHQVTAPFSENDEANKAEDITSSTNIQVKQGFPEPPLTMIFYEGDDTFMQTFFTDLTEAKKIDLKSPIDKKEPTYIVLLCEDQPDSKFIESGSHYYQYFSVKTIIKEIDQNMEYPTCESNTKSSMKIDTDDFYDIAFKLSVTEDQYNKGSESSINKDDLYVSFMKDFRITNALETPNMVFCLRIWFNLESMIPTAIQHTISAQMHFDDYDIKCQNMDLEKIEFERRETPVDIKATLSSAPDGFQWRQLVPMQDFKGIYTTKASCTYLNYVLLHNNVIESLQKIEKFIRRLADNLSQIHVVTGTYESVNNSSGQIVHSIPKILWKKITHFGPHEKEYSVLIVIHNQQTGRICSKEESTRESGWPGEDGAIGTMYDCFVEESIVNKLHIPMYAYSKVKEIEPFDLRRIHVKKNGKDYLMDVISKEQPSFTPKNSNWELLKSQRKEWKIQEDGN